MRWRDLGLGARVDDGACKIGLSSVLLSMEVDGSVRLASMYLFQLSR